MNQPTGEQLQRTQKSQKSALIQCSTCHKMAEPAVLHGIFCLPCWTALEAKLVAEPVTPVKSSVFSRNDGRLFE